MKGLLKAFGLIAALFILNSHASIYNDSTYLHPTNSIVYTVYYGSIVETGSDLQLTAIAVCERDQHASNVVSRVIISVNETNKNLTCKVGYIKDQYDNIGYINRIYTYSENLSDKKCPPSSNDLYTFSYDTDLDGNIDKCFNPAELDNNSKCSDLFNSGSILTAGSNTSFLVCKTFDDGSRCAFSRVEQGSTPYYQPNLEKGCFGDAEEIPDYDNDNPPSPQPEQCTPYFGGFACAADPKNYCSSTGVCVDGCGYVNDQFICFRDEECKGASCEPAPVNCETVPDAPICKDKETTPEPSFCEKNPTVESCQSGSNFCKKNPLSPSCQLGGDGTGSGGSKFVLDYDKLIQGMKDAAKTLIDETPIPDNTAMDKSLDDENKAIKSDYDNFLNDGVFSEIRNTSQRPIFSSLETLFPTGSGTCSFNFGKFSIEICSTAEKLREILYWVFSILTLIYLRHLFYQTIRTSAGK